MSRVNDAAFSVKWAAQLLNQIFQVLSGPRSLRVFERQFTAHALDTMIYHRGSISVGSEDLSREPCFWP